MVKILCRPRLDAKRGPLKSGEFDTNDEKSPRCFVSGACGENGAFGQIRECGENGNFWQKLQISHKQRKIARGLAISRMWQMFKLDPESGPLQIR